jgi:serine/threonine-protein kinase PknG
LAELPGELTPKLAFAAASELQDARDYAARYYEMVWRTDHGYVSAAFGLARQCAREGDRAGAVAALDQVPTESAYFSVAAATAIEILLDDRKPEDLDEQTLLDAGKRAAALTLESTEKRATMRLRVFSAALGWLQAGNTSRTPRLLSTDFEVPNIRTEMEKCYRELAHATAGTWERIALVEKANAIRPRTRV